MARGKRKSGNNYTSKGERPNVSRSITKATRRDYMLAPMARVNNQIRAWLQSKNVMLTIPNPNKKETNKPMIRVPAVEVWGRPKPMQIKMRS